MSRVAINTGSVANDGTGDSLRIAGGIINDNFSEIYSQFGDGTDLTPTWDKSAAGINTTSSVGIGTTNPRFTLEVGAVGASGTSLWVNGNARVTGILTVGSSSIVLDGNANKILVGSGISFDGNTGIISATAFYAGGSIITGGGGGGGLNYWGSSASGISTTANVAIGTVTPTSKLTVVGNSLFSGIATFRSNLTLANLTSSSNTLRFGSNSYIDQSNNDTFTFQINSGTDGSGTDSSFVFRTTEPGVSPIPDQAYDALRVYSGGNYWNRLVRVYTNFHADNNAFVGGDLQVGAASTLIGAGSTLGSFKVGAGGTVITTTSAGFVGIGTSVPNSNLHVVGISTFNGDVHIDDKLYVSGVEITGSGGGGGGASIGEDIVTRNLKATGITTLGITSATSLNLQQLNVSGITTISGDGTNAYLRYGSSNAYTNFVTTYNVSQVGGVPLISADANGAALSADTTLNAAYWRIRTLPTGAEVNGALNVSGISTLGGIVINSVSPALSFKTPTDNDIFSISYDTNNDDITFYYKQSGGTGGSQVIWYIPETSSFVLRNPAVDEKLAQFTTGGSVELHYDGSKKFETLGAGVTVTGTTFTNQLSVSGVSTFSGDISVGVSTAHGVILTSPNGTEYRLIVANDGTLSTTAV